MLIAYSTRPKKHMIISATVTDVGIFHRHQRKIDTALAHNACPGCRKWLFQWPLQTYQCCMLHQSKINAKTFLWHSHLLSLKIDTLDSDFFRYCLILFSAPISKLICLNMKLILCLKSFLLPCFQTFS